RLRRAWRSPVYSLYQSKVAIEYEGSRKYHLFTCGNKKCRLGRHGKPATVRRYLDSKDARSTGNLTSHAKACRGEETYSKLTSKDDSKAHRDGNIFLAFGKQLAKKVRSFSSRPHTGPETRANIVRWITESNRPANIVKDQGFETLMKTGRPSTTLPSPRQVSRDIHASFNLSKDRIATLLQEHPGQLSFTTDAWTSPNHRAIVAWVVHLEHEGQPLSFLLDVKELPEVFFPSISFPSLYLLLSVTYWPSTCRRF
ncbi:hypothetical protein B0H16DRAFT_1220698, partial [Mycena metata]